MKKLLFSILLIIGIIFTTSAQRGGFRGGYHGGYGRGYRGGYNTYCAPRPYYGGYYRGYRPFIPIVVPARFWVEGYWILDEFGNKVRWVNGYWR